ncbi:MAG TPA: hypothetical protein VFS60_19490 [Thermoanaerobaculia bacterium]|nr:hypothetical protein [Thermoanaerobaculia bacterium]
MSSEPSFQKLVYALRCAPSIGGAPCVLIRDWVFKRDLLGIQLSDLPQLSDAYAKQPTLPTSGDSSIRLINHAIGMRVASVAESAANTVYSMAEIAAQLGNRVSRGQLSTSFNSLQKAAAAKPEDNPWLFEEGLRGYRRVRELRTEWTHHSSTFVFTQEGGTILVVKGTRRAKDRLEFSDQIVCSPADLQHWCEQACRLLDSFGAHLLSKHVVAMYDLDHEIIDFVFDEHGFPALRDGRPYTRKLTIRRYFQEGGILPGA